MDDKILALLGDRSAQERITERGELLPCQCGGNAELVFQHDLARIPPPLRWREELLLAYSPPLWYNQC